VTQLPSGPQPTGDSRLLLIDENLTPRIAAELRKRRKNSIAIVKTNLKGSNDPDLLRAIAREYKGAVLVTADDNMPATHADVLAETAVTLAIVAALPNAGYSHEEWEREIVHRWAHKMEEQPPGSVRRYFLAGGREWHSRRRTGRSR